MYELVHIHMLLNLRKIRESKMNWVPFYQILFGSLYVARKLPTYPSPEPTSTLTSHNRIVTICLFFFLFFFLPLFLNTEKARRQSTFSQKGRLTLVPPSQGSLSPSSFFCFLFFFSSLSFYLFSKLVLCFLIKTCGADSVSLIRLRRFCVGAIFSSFQRNIIFSPWVGQEFGGCI